MNNNKSGIFLNWLQNFAMIVFTQSFHAVFLVFILKMMTAIYKETSDLSILDDGSTARSILAIVSIAGTAALIKFEKMIKQLFGIGDSKFMGGLGQNFAKTLGAVASGKALYDRTSEPFKKRKELSKQRNKIQDKINALEKSSPTGGGSGGSSGSQSGTTNNNISADISGTVDAATDGNGGANGTGRISDLITALEKNTNAVANSTNAANESKGEDKAEKLAKLQEELANIDAETKISTRQMFTRTGSTLASAAFGFGATEDASQFLTVTNLVDAPLDAISDRRIEKSVYKNKSKALDAEIQNIRKEIESANPTLDATQLEAAVERATKGLRDAKISIDDKIPDGLRKNLADIWRDVQKETPRNSIHTRSTSSTRPNKGSSSVDDI